MLFSLYFFGAFSFPNCNENIVVPKGIHYYEFKMDPDYTICFASVPYFYVFLNNYNRAVVSADYKKSMDSGSSLKSIYFDSTNSSSTSSFLDFGKYSGLVGIHSLNYTIARLHTVVLDTPCQDKITVTNSATDTFYLSPQYNQQCVFPFPICESVSALFDPNLPKSSYLQLFFAPNQDQLKITSLIQQTIKNPFYFFIHSKKGDNSINGTGHVRFTYTGSKCTKATKRVSAQIPMFEEEFRTLSIGQIIGIVVGSILLVVVVAIIVVVCVIKRRHLQESKTKESDNSRSYNFTPQTSNLDDAFSERLSDAKEISDSGSDFAEVEPILDQTPSYFYS